MERTNLRSPSLRALFETLWCVRATEGLDRFLSPRRGHAHFEAQARRSAGLTPPRRWVPVQAFSDYSATSSSRKVTSRSSFSWQQRRTSSSSPKTSSTSRSSSSIAESPAAPCNTRTLHVPQLAERHEYGTLASGKRSVRSMRRVPTVISVSKPAGRKRTFGMSGRLALLGASVNPAWALWRNVQTAARRPLFTRCA